MATYICKRTLAQNPGFSVTQLVEALAQQIPTEKQAMEFRIRLLYSSKTVSYPPH